MVCLSNISNFRNNLENRYYLLGFAADHMFTTDSMLLGLCIQIIDTC